MFIHIPVLVLLIKLTRRIAVFTSCLSVKTISSFMCIEVLITK